MAKSTVASLRDPPNVAEQPPRLGQHSPRHALGNGPGHHRELHRGPQRQGCRAHRRRPLGHRPRADILRGVPRYAMPVSGGPEATALHDLAVDRHGGHLASARRAVINQSPRARAFRIDPEVTVKMPPKRRPRSAQFVPGCPGASRFVCDASTALAVPSAAPAAYRCGQTAVEQRQRRLPDFSGNRL